MMCSKKVTLFLIGMLCLCIASAQAVEVRVEPECQTVLKGENFTVDIIVYPEESEEILGAQYDLYYNNTLLNVTSQTKGSFLSHDGASTFIIVNKINNTLGMTEYGEMRTGVAYGVTIPGVLATITFQAIADEEGISKLRLDKVKISDPTGNPISANVTSGNVSVKIGICGDVDGYPGVTTNDGWMIYMNLTFPSNPQYVLTSTWAADCDGYPGVTTNDGWLIYMNLTFPGDPLYSLGCC